MQRTITLGATGSGCSLTLIKRSCGLVSCRSSSDYSLRTSVTIRHGIIAFSWHSRMEAREALVRTQTRRYGVSWRKCILFSEGVGPPANSGADNLPCHMRCPWTLSPPCHPFKDLSRESFRLPRITPPRGIIFVEF